MNEPASYRPSNRDAPPVGAGLSAWVGRLLRGALRLVLTLLGFVLLLGALFMGLLLALGLLAWALLRGRRPARGVFASTVRRARQRSPWPEASVIDVEAREVPDARAPADRR